MIKKIDFGIFFAAIIVFLAVMNGFYWLYVYGDKFPHIDEWNFVPVSGDFFEYIFRFNNENLQVFTNLMFWSMESIGLPWVCAKYISYFLYLLMVFLLFYILRKRVRGNFILYFLALPFFTHYAIEMLIWVNLSQYWMYFICVFGAIYFGFNEKEVFQNIWLALLMILFSIFATNVSFAICFSLVYIAKNILNAKTKVEKKKSLYGSLIFLESIVFFIVVFWVNMRKGDETVILWSKLFSVEFFYWLCYVLFAPCFGMLLPKDNMVLVLIVGFVLFFFVGCLFFRQIKDKNKQIVWALFLVICGGMSAIVLFRGTHVLELDTYASRYIVYGACVCPVIYALFAQDNNRKIRCIGNVLALVMLLCIGCNFFGNRILITYKANEISRECIMKYYNFPDRPLIYYCPGKYWGNISPKLSRFEKVYLQ